MATFRGGMEFPSGHPMRVSGPPEFLPAHPLRIHCLERPEVHAGQVVRAGQALLSPSASGRACLVSPAAGTVRSVRQVEGAAAGYEVLIEPASERISPWLEVQPPRGRKFEAWFPALRSIGLGADHDGGVGLVAQLAEAERNPPAKVICVGLDEFPPYPDRSSLLVSFPDDAVLGTLVLADLVGAKHPIMLASSDRSVVRRLRPACKNYSLKLLSGNELYPAADPLLVTREFGKSRHLHGHNPVRSGVLLVHPWTAIRIGRWFTLHRYDVAHPVFLAWPRHDAAMTFTYALPGQPLGSLDDRLRVALASHPERIVLGNPMTGLPPASPAEAVVEDDQTLVCELPAMSRHAEEPCISCGWCAEVCPTGLRPVHLVNLLSNRRDDGRLVEDLASCIECGMCSHVCPSSIALAERLRAAKRVIPGMGVGGGHAG